jgi:OmpA family
MFRATGPGKFEIFADYSGVGIMKALLYNFDFDDFADYKQRAVKVEHKTFLADKVVPLLENDLGNIWMQGSASRIGTNAWNKVLSQNRVVNVASFLSERGIDSEQMQLDAVGEELAATHTEDDERDRSVMLLVLPKMKFTPPPPRVVPPRPLVSRHFKIALITGLSVSQALNVAKIFRGVKLGAGLAIDGIFFMVWDTRNNISCLYVYVGLGLGVGISLTPKVSATTHGPWTEFTTEKPISCWQFGRWARFTTAGAINNSLNWITLETPKGVDNVDSLAIDTGTTLGAGMSSTIGDFIRVDQPHRFSGP